MDAEINLAHVLYEYKKCPEELKTKYMEAVTNLTLSGPGDLRSLQNLTGGGAKGVADISKLLKK